MSDTEKVEQITKEPEKVEKIKDPKKVAAGKRLAEYHKKAKKALESAPTETTWMPDISLTTALSLVGITLTAVDLYFRWRKTNNGSSPDVKDGRGFEPPEIKKSKVPTSNSSEVKRMGME